MLLLYKSMVGPHLDYCIMYTSMEAMHISGKILISSKKYREELGK